MERNFVPALVEVGRGNLVNGLIFEHNPELGKKRLLRALEVCPSKCNRETNYSLFVELAFNSAFNEERKSDYFNKRLVEIARASCSYGDLECNQDVARFYMEQKLYDKAKDIFQMIILDNEKDSRILSDAGADAAIELGNIYYQGLGLKQDLEQAKKYYGMACDYKSNDNQKACDLYREVNEKLH